MDDAAFAAQMESIRRGKVKQRNIILAVVVGLCVLFVLASLIPDRLPSQGEKKSTTDTLLVIQEALQAVVDNLKAQKSIGLNQNWRYNYSEDKMSSTTSGEASTTSTNTVSFNFPYEGIQRATLTLRKHPRYGRNVILQIERGQFLTSLNPVVLVRFDDRKAIRFETTGPADHSTTTAFIDDYARFVKEVKKSTKLRIEVPIYQAGSPVFEFDVAGLDWK